MSDVRTTIETILASRIGLDAATIGSSVIPRAVKSRMNELGLFDVNGYTSLLGSSEVELQALIEEVVVPESWFFRDEVPFRHFQDHVRSNWVANPSRSTLRVLSIPCAGGEEPYSIVIALVEAGLAARRYEITAIDVSARRLEIARCGIFSSNAFRGSDLSFRDRYFRSHPKGFEIDSSLRDRIRFLRGSILDADLLSGEPAFNVLFCRNLLIYFDEPSRVRALSTLDRLIAEDGLLIIGHADRLNLNAINPEFTQTGDRRAFTYRKAMARSLSGSHGTTVTETATWQIPQLPSPRPPKLLTWQPTQWQVTKTASQVSENTPSYADVEGGKDTSSQSPHQRPSGLNVRASAPLLDQASELANHGRHDDAVALCEQFMRQRGPSAAAYYLMGVLHQSAGNRPKGEECFQKAVYLDPGHDEALLALALSAERRGDTSAAAGFRRRAERAISRKGVTKNEQ